MLVVGGGDASDSELVSIVELTDVTDDPAAAADAKTEAAVKSSSLAADDVPTAAVENVGRGSSVALGLSTGHFDVANVKLLRTCSEPDLSRLFQSMAMTSRKSVGNSGEARLTGSRSNNCVCDDVTTDVVSCSFSPLL